MEPAFDGGRLSVDSGDRCFATIESLDQSCKVEQISNFKIEPKHEHDSEVCSNQDALEETATLIDLPIKSEIWIENVKIEPSSDQDELDELENISTEDLRAQRVDRHSNDDSSCEEPPSKKSKYNRIQPWKTKEQKSIEDRFITRHFRLACPLCDESCVSFFQIRTHFLRIHNRREAYVICCDKRFYQRHLILKHLYKELHDIFPCMLCSERYMNTEALSEHLSEGKGQYTCDTCEVSFKQQCAFDMHKKGHSEPRCIACNEVFASKDLLSSHMHLEHNVDRSKACTICGEKFLTKESLQFHLNTQHLGLKYSTFQCEVCQRWLKNERTYKLHMNDVHGSNREAKKIQCEICMKVYPYKRALQNHKRYVHVEPKFECDVCGKKFKKNVSLKDHRVGHTGAPLFQCEFCEYKTTNRSGCYVHTKKHHPHEWAEKRLMPPQGLSDTK